MEKQPKLMNFSRMREILTPHIAEIREHIFMNSELAIIHGDPKVFRLILQHEIGRAHV